MSLFPIFPIDLFVIWLANGVAFSIEGLPSQFVEILKENKPIKSIELL